LLFISLFSVIVLLPSLFSKHLLFILNRCGGLGQQVAIIAGLIGQDGGQVVAMAVMVTEVDIVVMVVVMVAVMAVMVVMVVMVVNNFHHHNRMNSSVRFFLLYIAVCLAIIILFYFIFKRSEVLPIRPYDFQKKRVVSSPNNTILASQDPLRRKMNKGVPGMDPSELGKPLPAPKMPVAPVPLIVRV